MTLSELAYFYTPDQWVGIGFGLAAIIVLVYFWRSHRKTTALDRHLKQAVDQVGSTRMRDAMLPDGMEGFIFIDYIILTPGGIMLFYLVNMPGYIFGAMKMDEWTQMIGRKSIRFRNPLYGLGEAIRVVCNYVPNIPVDGRVVFADSAEFPKGVPEKVCSLKNLPEELGKFSKHIDEFDLQAAWNQLTATVEQTRAENQVDQRITRYNRV